MTAAVILQELVRLRIELQVLSPDRLHVVAPVGALTPALVERIKPLKGELIGAIIRRDLRRVSSWLDHVGENDPAIRMETLDKCRTDPEAMRYYLTRARETYNGREALLLLALGQDNAYLVADPDSDPVIISVVARGKGACDLAIPRDRWNPFLFLRYLGEQRQ